jgi:hypothetical protein
MEIEDGMSRKTLASKLYYGSCCFVLLFVAAAASFNGYYDSNDFRKIDKTTSFNTMAHGGSARSFYAMVDGSAARPFVYRQLLPMLANWIDLRISQQTKDRLFAAKTRTGVRLRELLFNSPVAQDRAYFLRYWIVYALTFLFAWIAVYAMYLLCKSAGYASTTAALSAIIVILLLPIVMLGGGGGYFYDYPELAFFALAAWMALNFDWWLMIPVAALAAWNKESFLFFIPALYPLLRQRSSRISALVGTGILGLTCGAVYLMLRAHFQYNPGSSVDMHFMHHIPFMLQPLNWLYPQRAYGIYMMPALNPLSVPLIVWTVWRGWRFLSKPIQRHAQIAALINFPLYFLFGTPGELRNLSMLYVTLLMLLAANLTGRSVGHT